MEKEVIGRRRICFFGGIDGRHGHSSKLFPSVLERIQSELDKGKSVYSIAKQEGVSEGSIRYWIKQGELKKKIVPVLVGSPTVSRSDRSAQDAQSGADMGIAVSRVEERALAATGAQSYAQTLFDPNESVENGGVLFSLSALISQGLDRLFTFFLTSTMRHPFEISGDFSPKLLIEEWFDHPVFSGQHHSS